MFFSTPSQTPPPQLNEAWIEGIAESINLQFFFTGIYSLIFFRAIVFSIRRQNRYVTAALVVIFIAVITNLIAVWQMFRSVVVTHNATQSDMVQEFFNTGHSRAQKTSVITLSLAILVSDTLLAWRCIVLWDKSRWMVLGYCVLLFGEIVSLPVCVALNITMGSHWDFLDIYFALSLAVTFAASILIIYRIITVSRQSHNDINPYHYIIKILVESGFLYTANILICGLLLILQVSGIYTPGLIRATYDFNAILVPVTGIAPTLITARTANVGDNIESESQHPQTISQLCFNHGESEVESILIADPYPSNNPMKAIKRETELV